ncbi:Short-chain dehydrogenase [Penicillium riverlandense]|uniref:Short-chain dehydrogenase n=1 Tax=Penicillium riverlandense TaxID=1903569 RepID=UPI002548A1C0|nr:Short-chain dehydrogenase [Penicillium riverlandense]KAJ5815179.1 Short-chain dehydrogenase [Penicillium riverlandense]
MACPAWVQRWVHPKDSVVIITGAGSGIGMATALLAAEQGYQVAAWDIVEGGVQKTKELAGDLSSQIYPIICDVADETAVKAAMEKTVAIGKPHMLVNNAGPVAIGKTAGFMDMTSAAFGMVHFITTAFLDTNPVEGSSIVNISSVVGPIFGGGGPWYAAAKAGIAGYTKNLAVQLKGSTRVNTVAPGGRKGSPDSAARGLKADNFPLIAIRTPRNSKFIDEGVFSKTLERNPTGRPGKPEELANGILFLLSPAASYINGHLLAIDGGLSIAE